MRSLLFIHFVFHGQSIESDLDFLVKFRVNKNLNWNQNWTEPFSKFGQQPMNACISQNIPHIYKPISTSITTIDEIFTLKVKDCRGALDRCDREKQLQEKVENRIDHDHSNGIVHWVAQLELFLYQFWAAYHEYEVAFWFLIESSSKTHEHVNVDS